MVKLVIKAAFLENRENNFKQPNVTQKSSLLITVNTTGMASDQSN